MLSRSPSPEFSPLAFGEDLVPIPAHKHAGITEIDLNKLLGDLFPPEHPPLLVYEDVGKGCGGQLWPAGMVLMKQMIRYHRETLKNARILELGAGGGLVGLAVAKEFAFDGSTIITDQECMLDLMARNVVLNKLGSRVSSLILNWGEPLPKEVIEQKPNVILAADCVYNETAFAPLISTLEELLELCNDAVIYFCFKYRRRADRGFMMGARKRFKIDEIEDEDRKIFSRENLFLYTFRRKE
ncbi:putative methyltransferase-domain-containing protein [Tricladium varicosporioides]|nr:putative methyltransferase-domain-containing protein [Hymenoscyphus varicosporioides]